MSPSPDPPVTPTPAAPVVKSCHCGPTDRCIVQGGIKLRAGYVCQRQTPAPPSAPSDGELLRISQDREAAADADGPWNSDGEWNEPAPPSAPSAGSRKVVCPNCGHPPHIRYQCFHNTPHVNGLSACSCDYEPPPGTYTRMEREAAEAELKELRAVHAACERTITEAQGQNEAQRRELNRVNREADRLAQERDALKHRIVALEKALAEARR